MYCGFPGRISHVRIFPCFYRIYGLNRECLRVMDTVQKIFVTMARTQKITFTHVFCLLTLEMTAWSTAIEHWGSVEALAYVPP
jgi:hypothetical protein